MESRKRLRKYAVGMEITVCIPAFGKKGMFTIDRFGAPPPPKPAGYYIIAWANDGPETFIFLEDISSGHVKIWDRKQFPDPPAVDALTLID